MNARALISPEVIDGQQPHSNRTATAQVTSRPEYPHPVGLPDALAAAMIAAAARKAVWVNPEGVAFWLNDNGRAEAIAAKHGGIVFPPEVTP